jgi:hypothetical protein
MLAAMIAFFFMYWAPFRESEASRPAMRYAADPDLTGLLIGAALVAGLAADTVLTTTAPTPARPRRMWAVGALIPLATWVPYYAVLAAVDGLGQAAPVWTGSIVWAVVAGGALALLMAPPPVPAVLDPPLMDPRPYPRSGDSAETSFRSGRATVPPGQRDQEGHQHE